MKAQTGELTEALVQLKALGEVGQAVSSTLNLETVLTTIVARAVQLSRTAGGLVYEYDETRQEFHVRAAHQVGDELVEAARATPIGLGEGAVGFERRPPVPSLVKIVWQWYKYNAYLRHYQHQL